MIGWCGAGYAVQPPWHCGDESKPDFGIPSSQRPQDCVNPWRRPRRYVWWRPRATRPFKSREGARPRELPSRGHAAESATAYGRSPKPVWRVLDHGISTILKQSPRAQENEFEPVIERCDEPPATGGRSMSTSLKCSQRKAKLQS